MFSIILLQSDAGATAAEAVLTPKKQNWKAVVDSIRLLNVIIKLKAAFLDRDIKLTREQLDANQKKPFWALLAMEFMSNDADLDVMIGDSQYWSNLGLSSRHSGFVITPAKAEQVFKDLRSEHMKTQAKFRVSGGGDGGPVAEHTSVVEFSSNFRDFTVGYPVNEYFYEVLITHHLLESAATDLPPNAASSSSSPGSSTVTSKKRVALLASPSPSVSASSSSASGASCPPPSSTLVRGGGKGGAHVAPDELMQAIKGSVSSPATKAAEAQTSKNMASKTAVGVKRGLLALYNDSSF